MVRFGVLLNGFFCYGKKNFGALVLKICWLPFITVSCLMALPQNPTIVAENAKFVSQNGELVINADDRSIINWDSFSIDVNERVEFVQPNSAAVVLNRVIGNNPSSIFGSLASNGQVVLLNQHGILFDASSRINTGSFIASSFDLIDSAFHNEGRLVFRGTSKGSISFSGQIDASGDFYVVSDSISHEGPIRVKDGDAGFFALGKMELGEAAPHPIFQRTACQGLEISIHASTRIDADQQFYSQSGYLSLLSSLDTSGFTTNRNSIFATGSMIYLGDSAVLSASRRDGGGDIYLGGVERGNSQVLDRSSVVVLCPGASIQASAGSWGNGGKIILWSERNTEFHCDLKAIGGQMGGDGGFIEVSSLGNLGIHGIGSTEAPMGKTGIFLIDPSDVIINNVANTNIGPFIPAPPPPVPGQNYSFTASPATILNTTLTGLLAANNVLIDTNNGVGGTGNITVLNTVSWASAFSLFLTANGSITIRSTVENTGGVGVGGNLTLNAGTDVVLDAITPGAAVLAGTRNGTISVTAGGSVRLLAAAVNNASATIGTTAAVVNNAVINVTAGADIQLTGNNATNAFALIGSSSASANTGTITLSANNNVLLNAGTVAGSFAAVGSSGAAASTRAISITARNNMQLLAGNSFTLVGSASTSTDSGAINITTTNDLTLTAGTVAGAFALIGSSAGTNSNRPMTITVGRDLTLNGGSAAGTTTCAGIGSGGNAVNIGTIGINVTRNATLQAGTGTGGFALVGGFRETNRDITLTAGNNVQLNGANSFALIGSSSTTTDAGNLIVGAGNDLSLNAGTVAASFALIGSSAGTNSNRPTTITVGRDLTLNGGSAAGTTTYAAIGSGGNAVNIGTIGINVTRNTTLQAGTGTGGFALIGGFRETNRAINLTSGNDVRLVGNNAFAQIGSSSITTDAGTITLSANNDLILTAGANAGSFASIGSSGTTAGVGGCTRAFAITVGRDLSMTGGGSTTSFASIGSAGSGVTATNSGNINIDVTRNATVQGGTGNGGFALIGGFLLSARTITMNVGNDLTILGGTGGSDAVGAPFAIVGSYQGVNSGDINVKVGHNLFIRGGTTPIALNNRVPCAAIGRAGEGTTFPASSSITSFNIDVANNLTIYGGSNPNKQCSGYIGWGGNQFLGGPGVTAPANLGNITINVGHNLEMATGLGGGAASIVGGTQRPCQGNVVINVGEYMWMHHLNPAQSNGLTGCLIGGSGQRNQWLLNFYITVGKTLTMDSRNGAFTSFHCFNTGGNFVNQGIIQFRIGGDLVFIGGNNTLFGDIAVIWLHPNMINEIWVGGNWRAYNGSPTGSNNYAGVESNTVFGFGNIGQPDWRAGGNLIVAGGSNGSIASSFTPANPMTAIADYPFAPGQLWAPKSTIVNGSNIFTGTPLGAISTNTSTVAPFHSGGDGLGGFAVDTNAYLFSTVTFPTTITGPTWSVSTPLPPAPGVVNNVFVKYYAVGVFGPGNLLIQSSDVFDNGSPADFSIGTVPQTVQLQSFFGDVTVQGFRDTLITDFNSVFANVGTITIDTVRDLRATNSTTTAGTDIDLTAGRDIILNGGNMFAGGDLFQQAEDNINLTDSIESAAAGDLLSIAGNNSSFINSSAIANNNIDWVIDNDFPASPLMGPSAFNMDATSFFSAGLGYIRVYTSRQGLNNISPLAQFISNGSPFTFVPGTLFTDTAQEQWCTYYPNGTLGVPFRIFYKDCFQEIVEQATVVVVQFLVDLHPYNEFPGWIEEFSVNYDKLNAKFGPDKDQPNQNYFLRRRNLNVINQPKSYTVWLGDTLD